MGAIYVCLSLDFVWRVPIIYVVSSSFPVVGFFFFFCIFFPYVKKKSPFLM